MGNGVQNNNATAVAPMDRASLESFKRDIIALFSGTKGGHTSRWTYTGRERPAHHDSGATLWREFLNANNNPDNNKNKYYIPANETGLIEKYIPQLAERFKKADALIDLGSGSRFAVENKSMPLLKACPKIGIYVPVDLSEELLREAETVAKEMVPDRQVIPVAGDFYYRNRNGRRPSVLRQELSLPGKARAGVMFGSTISNMNMTLDDEFPTANIVEKITDLGYLMKKDAKGPSSLTFAYDSNQDFNGSALEAYDNIHWKRMVHGLMIDVQTILQPAGFDAFGFEYVGVPDRPNSVIHQCVRATKNMAFMIDDQAFAIKKDDHFVVVNNIKYQPEHMSDLIRQAGYTPEKPMRMKDNHMVLHTMEIPHDTPEPAQ